MKLLFKKYNIFKGPYQKIIIINELIEIFSLHHSFIEGKRSALMADEILNYMCYIICKIYPKSLIRLTKYLYMFEINDQTLSNLTSSLVKIRLIDCADK